MMIGSYCIISRDSAKGLVCDTTYITSEDCAHTFAMAMAEDGYHTTLSLEILVVAGKRKRLKDAP